MQRPPRPPTASTSTKPPTPTCGPEEHGRRAKRRALPGAAFERAASLFRVAGEVERLRLLDRLSDGEWCVTELADAAGVALSNVSQQLRLLRAERIVTRRRAGKHVYYALADRHMSELIRNVLEHASEEVSAGDGSHE
jgi:ArsR family transcriptional regulator, lead/cadmium/zinc/bismuth-responsive transcriptional repressor